MFCSSFIRSCDSGGDGSGVHGGGGGNTKSSRDGGSGGRGEQKMNIRKWRHRSRQPSQEQRRTHGAESAVHLPGKQRKRRRECRAHRRVARQRARSERPVRDDDVGERRREDEVGARAEWNRREHGHDPGHAVVSRESEREERKRHEDAAYLSHQQTELCWRISTMYFLVPSVLSSDNSRVRVSSFPDRKRGRCKGKICESHRFQ